MTTADSETGTEYSEECCTRFVTTILTEGTVEFRYTPWPANHRFSTWYPEPI